MSCLRWELFMKLWMRFTTKWIIWNPGLQDPGRQREGVPQECVAELEESPLEELCHLPSVFFTNCILSNSPRSKYVLNFISGHIYNFINARYYVWLIIVILRTSVVLDSCISDSLYLRQWCTIGLRPILMMRRYVYYNDWYPLDTTMSQQRLHRIMITQNVKQIEIFNHSGE